jgi:hypothetical protein
MLKNVVPHSVATAFASMVLPVPGGPYKSTPRHGRSKPVKNCGKSRGHHDGFAKQSFRLTQAGDVPPPHVRVRDEDIARQRLGQTAKLGVAPERGQRAKHATTRRPIVVVVSDRRRRSNVPASFQLRFAFPVREVLQRVAQRRPAGRGLRDAALLRVPTEQRVPRRRAREDVVDAAVVVDASGVRKRRPTVVHPRSLRGFVSFLFVFFVLHVEHRRFRAKRLALGGEARGAAAPRRRWRPRGRAQRRAPRPLSQSRSFGS